MPCAVVTHPSYCLGELRAVLASSDASDDVVLGACEGLMIYGTDDDFLRAKARQDRILRGTVEGLNLRARRARRLKIFAAFVFLAAALAILAHAALTFLTTGG